MNPRAARRFERLGSAASAVVLGLTAWATITLWRPVAPWTPPLARPHGLATMDQHATRSVGLGDLAVIWQRDLRQPVVDAVAKVEPPAPEPAPSVQLLGTAIESDRRYGLFRLANQTTVLRSVGTEVEGFAVIAIERGVARLRAGSHEYELKVPWYDRIVQTEHSNGG